MAASNGSRRKRDRQHELEQKRLRKARRRQTITAAKAVVPEEQNALHS